MENTDAVVENAVNALTLALWTIGGAAAGLVVALLILLTIQVAGRKSALMVRLRRRTRSALAGVMMSLGAWVAYGIEMPTGNSSWYAEIHHVLLLILIAALGWYFYAFARLIEDATLLRIEKDKRNSRRMQTQAQILQRVTQSIVVVITFVAALLTFPAARAPMASLLASAGVLSVVAGLAAQSTLGNVFAGLQLAFTDAIRVGDMVSAVTGGKEEMGTVEEVTLTYVVLRVWDERRILLPSSEFTSKPFENWTRRDTGKLGAVMISFDWPVPMAQIRQEVRRLLGLTDLWDGRTWNVQMTDSSGICPVVRVVVSAGNPGDMHDLKCYIRENLVAWAAANVSWAIPRTRIVPQEVEHINRDVSDQKVAELAEELSGIAAQNQTQEELPAAAETSPEMDPVHAARLRASRVKAKKARRRSVMQRRAQLPPLPEPSAFGETMVMTAPDLWAQASKEGRGERLFSGSKDAEERRKIYDGPGEEVLRQREETAVMQALDARGEDSEDLEKEQRGKHAAPAQSDEKQEESHGETEDGSGSRS